MKYANINRSAKRRAPARKLNAGALLGLGLLGVTPLVFYGSLLLLFLRN